MFLAESFLALMLDRIGGYPSVFQRNIGHPVQLMGWLIQKLDLYLNDPEASAFSCIRGILAILLLFLSCVVPILVLVLLLRKLEGGWILESLLATPLLAQKSLADHVQDVHRSLDRDLVSAQRSVSRIVGRDCWSLDESGVSTAAIESLAESSCDGVVAPVFFLLVGGLPGILFYKLVNTADSMIGHRTPRYLRFGWAAARLDDLLNFVPARLTGLFLICTEIPSDLREFFRRFSVLWRDGGKHVSPNAGYPESAMAAVLGIRLGGPRCYQGVWLELPYLGEGAFAQPEDLGRALRLYTRLLNLLAGFVLLLFLFHFVWFPSL